ncbi:YbhB/YbcL family Raf kinase inhibitor-like protein [Agrococcus jejuensis]|uniref:YbhB/YbcL family Raf kinase inhibitor-like protein n=1 Tax=Agrococcus jejuensis TaxID=399736 RepID=UPI00119DB8F4|nr:YbhB/YbcL family Raf kinase inhibitor-like protein [Agrococcus jejuensis]
MTFDPYAALPSVPSFALTSSAFGDGDTLPMPQISAMASPDGGDATPQLSWSGAPEGTQGYALTCLDPDAPTGSGFWHLAVFGIPASVTELSEGAVVLDRITDAALEGAHVLRNDGGVRGFVGAAPPPGHGVHRYMFVVHALDVAELEIDESASPGLLGFQLFGHTLGRARLTGVFGH